MHNTEDLGGSQASAPYPKAAVYGFAVAHGATVEALLRRVAGYEAAKAAYAFRRNSRPPCSRALLTEALRALHEALAEVPFAAFEGDTAQEDAAAVNWFGARVSELAAALG